MFFFINFFNIVFVLFKFFFVFVKVNFFNFICFCYNVFILGIFAVWLWWKKYDNIVVVKLLIVYKLLMMFDVFVDKNAVLSVKILFVNFEFFSVVL